MSFDAKHIFFKPTAQQEMNTGTYAADKTNKVISMIWYKCKITDPLIARGLVGYDCSIINELFVFEIEISDSILN